MKSDHNQGFNTVEKSKVTQKKSERGHGWAKLERIKTECIRGNLKSGAIAPDLQL